MRAMAILAMLDYGHGARGRRPLHPGRSGVMFWLRGRSACWTFRMNSSETPKLLHSMKQEGLT